MASQIRSGREKAVFGDHHKKQAQSKISLKKKISNSEGTEREHHKSSKKLVIIYFCIVLPVTII